ncbi:MAG: patatin-like phospholipase family protein [Ruminococcus sp.]|nr:patatin-like phospholipase family protein [Ruminococcus sp.]
MAKSYANRIDFSRFFTSSVDVDFAATCCEDGSAAYLSDHHSKKRLLQALMASCALPIICRSVSICDRHYVDGSIVAPIHFSHLLEKGVR